MSKLRLYKQPKAKSSSGVKSCGMYAETHKKLVEASEESGVTIIMLTSMLINFALENLEIIDGSKEEVNP